MTIWRRARSNTLVQYGASMRFLDDDCRMRGLIFVGTWQPRGGRVVGIVDHSDAGFFFVIQCKVVAEYGLGFYGNGFCGLDLRRNLSRDGCDKTVSTLGDGLDHAGRLWIVSEDISN